MVTLNKNRKYCRGKGTRFDLFTLVSLLGSTASEWRRFFWVMEHMNKSCFDAKQSCLNATFSVNRANAPNSCLSAFSEQQMDNRVRGHDLNSKQRHLIENLNTESYEFTFFAQSRTNYLTHFKAG